MSYTLRFTLFSLLLLAVSAASARICTDEENTGAVKGKVTTADGRPVADATVLIKNLQKSTLTGEDGSFSLYRIEPGTYTVEIVLVGFEKETREVQVEASRTTVLRIQLDISSQQLADVTVTSRRNKFQVKNSDYVARMPLKNLENPQVYNTVSKELLQEQMNVSFDDAVKNTPGLDKLWSSTGRAGDGAAYFSIRGFSVQPTLVNGIAGLTNGGLDPANLERIEAIKGPSGTLFGSSLVSFGGLINIVTKKPYDSLGGELGYTGGGFGLSRLTADINTPLDKNKNVLFRLNGAYHYEGSFQDAGFKRSTFLAPSLSYKVDERLSFLLNAEFYTARATNPLMVFLNRSRQLIATTPQELGMDYKRSFTSNDITMSTPTVNVYGQMTYKLSDKWTSQTSVAQSTRKSNGYYSYVMFTGASDTLLSRYLTDQAATGTSLDIQQNFTGDFPIGSLRNRLVAGLDFFNTQTHNNNTAYAVFDNVSAIRNNDPRYGQLTKQAADAKLAQAGAPTKTGSNSNTYSAYVSDVLNITDRLMTMLSLRVDRFDNRGSFNYSTNTTTGKYAQTSFSPKFGLVYQLVKNQVAVFANYMNGFRNVAPVTQPLPEIAGTFKPQHANQLEAGVKLDVWNHQLGFTASYYDIQVSNMTHSSLLVKDGLNYLITVQDGTQSSRGAEFDLSATPLPGLNIVAGYSYNDSKMKKSDSSVLNRRPVSAGPASLANAWISYTAVKGQLKGLGIGFGGNYGSENKVTNTSTTGVFTLPAYTVLNATVFYNTRAFRIGLKVDNLTNKQYWKGWTTVEPQMLRRVSANITFRF
jgi:iron complex outermembrane receptor protein